MKYLLMSILLISCASTPDKEYPRAQRVVTYGFSDPPDTTRLDCKEVGTINTTGMTIPEIKLDAFKMGANYFQQVTSKYGLVYFCKKPSYLKPARI